MRIPGNFKGERIASHAGKRNQGECPQEKPSNGQRAQKDSHY
jgi:hypothetical protein